MASKKSSKYSAEAADTPAGGSEGNTGLVANPPENFLTEQEKGGKDPISPAVPMGSTKASEPGVGAREPYPTGAPWAPPTAGTPQNQQPAGGSPPAEPEEA